MLPEVGGESASFISRSSLTYQPIFAEPEPAAINAARLAAAARIRIKRTFIALPRSPSMSYFTGLACRWRHSAPLGRWAVVCLKRRMSDAELTPFPGMNREPSHVKRPLTSPAGLKANGQVTGCPTVPNSFQRDAIYTPHPHPTRENHTPKAQE